MCHEGLRECPVTFRNVWNGRGKLSLGCRGRHHGICPLLHEGVPFLHGLGAVFFKHPQSTFFLPPVHKMDEMFLAKRAGSCWGIKGLCASSN